jgi:RNA polymerase sigma-70 factor (ECF subfamily)
MGATDDDNALISQCLKGDHAAFESLIRMHQRMIHSLTFRMTGSLADGEDLAQQTFLRAYEQLGSFRGGAKFSSWLYRIAVNTCLNWRRREMRRRQLHAAWADNSSRQRAEPAHPADENDLGRRVQEALMKLPAKQRAAMVLTVYDGFNHAEAARILGCSETTVSWRIFAARNKLKRWLKPAARGSPGR